MALTEKQYYHFHIYVVSKKIHYDDRGGLATCLKMHPAVDSMGLYKEGHDIASILSAYRFINTIFIDPHTIGFEATEEWIRYLRDEKNGYRRICIVLLNRNRQGESLSAFIDKYTDRKHYLKLDYNYDVTDEEARVRLDNLLIECQKYFFEDLYQHELSVSYCSCDRPLVLPIIKLLQEKMNDLFTDNKERLFFDADKKDDLTGADLEKKLPEIYAEKSRYCVMFVSPDYINRKWTMLEFESALPRNEKEPGYIIPVSIGNAAIPGYDAGDETADNTKFTSKMVYYDIAEGAENIVSMILGKVWVMKPKSFNYFTG